MDLWALDTQSGIYEIDYVEEFNNLSGNAIHTNATNPANYNDGNQFSFCINYNGSICPNESISGGLDFTRYHTIAGRQTSDGTTDVVTCMWIDGQSQGCLSMRPNASVLNGIPAVFQFHSQIGSGLALGNGATGKDTLLRSFKVWSCAGVNSPSKCYSSSANP